MAKRDVTSHIGPIEPICTVHFVFINELRHMCHVCQPASAQNHPLGFVLYDTRAWDKLEVREHVLFGDLCQHSKNNEIFYLDLIW